MAQRYGNRWEIIDAPPLGDGGQSRVFRVRDLTGQPETVYALKRVLNPARHERFRAEVEATKRLAHPNIIKVVDHSALDDASGVAERQYLVMPIAMGGDLGRRERYSLYTGAVDAIILVAKQLADALGTAHKAGVIHRDVKPQNVLFTGNGHEVWLADFGICLVREMDRLTSADEVIGPRTFIAPELEEGGGNLNVTAAADVYSLGKVIYFMLSGGRELPRERLDEPQYNVVFQGGERHRLLQLLLRRMICLNQRIGTMDEILGELTKIEEWEQNARSLPISPAGLAQFDRLREKAFEKRRINDQNLAAREQEQATRQSVVSTFEAWLTGQLGLLGAAMTSDALSVEVKTAVQPPNNKFMIEAGSGMFVALRGIDFSVREAADPFRRIHLVQFYLCEHRWVIVTMGSALQPMPYRDLSLAVVPLYRQTLDHQHPSQSSLMGYLTGRNVVGRTAGHANPPQAIRGQRSRANFSRPTRVSPSFDPNLSHYIEFKASEWPANSERIRESVGEAIELFLEFINSGASSFPG